MLFILIKYFKILKFSVFCFLVKRRKLAVICYTLIFILSRLVVIEPL